MKIRLILLFSLFTLPATLLAQENTPPMDEPAPAEEDSPEEPEPNPDLGKEELKFTGPRAEEKYYQKHPEERPGYHWDRTPPHDRHEFFWTQKINFAFTYERAGSGPSDRSVRLSGGGLGLFGKSRLGYAFNRMGIFLEGGLGVNLGVANMSSDNPNGPNSERFGEFARFEGEFGIGTYFYQVLFATGVFFEEGNSQFGKEISVYRDRNNDGIDEVIANKAAFSTRALFFDIEFGTDGREPRTHRFEGNILSLRLFPLVEYDFADGRSKTWGARARMQGRAFTHSSWIYIEVGGFANDGPEVATRFWCRLGFGGSF